MADKYKFYYVVRTHVEEESCYVAALDEDDAIEVAESEDALYGDPCYPEYDYEVHEVSRDEIGNQEIAGIYDGEEEDNEE